MSRAECSKEKEGRKRTDLMSSHLMSSHLMSRVECSKKIRGERKQISNREMKEDKVQASDEVRSYKVQASDEVRWHVRRGSILTQKKKKIQNKNP